MPSSSAVHGGSIGRARAESVAYAATRRVGVMPITLDMGWDEAGICLLNVQVERLQTSGL